MAQKDIAKTVTILAIQGLTGLSFLTAGCQTILDTSGPPYAITNFQHDLKGNLTTEEKLNAYLRTKNGIHLDVWELVDAQGKRGLYASGQPYGRHFVEYATDEAFLNGNPHDGPNVPDGYSVRHIK